MKTKILGIFVITLMILASMIVMSDWDIGDDYKMHYPQLPDEDGWDVCATSGTQWSTVLADDWMCSESGMVTDMHFWGSLINGSVGTINNFVISIHADIPADPPDIPYSQPGETLWNRIFYPGEWIERPIDSSSRQGWYDPFTGIVMYDNHDDYFQYNILDITDPFIQTQGEIYWLSITAIVEEEDPQPLWGWKSTEDHWNDNACWYDPGYGWIDIWEPPSLPKENLFQVEFDPTGIFLFGDGTDYYDDGTSIMNGWYYYPNTDWYNIWFYDHPFDTERYKDIEVLFDLIFTDPFGWIEFAINWAQPPWPPGNPPPIPPLDPLDEDLYVGREIFQVNEGPNHIFFTIPDYNPEWVSIDVRGAGFLIPFGTITHDCLPQLEQTLDLAFVINGEEPNYPPVFGTPIPENNSGNNPLSFTWNIPINDPEGDSFDWSIECSNGQSNSDTGALNGTKTLSLSDLSYSTMYTVWVNATDPGGSGLYTRERFTFTTEANNPPNPPSNPYPLNGATSVGVNAILYWTCSDPDGDPLTFDVYFGDSSPPPLVSSGQSTFAYNPGTMNPHTEYYWQIVAWDNYGANTTGPVWNFTTLNNPPNSPSDPYPPNGATGVDVNSILSWTCSDPDGDPLVYDVYLEADDSTPNLLVSDDQTGTTYDPDGLEYGTLYYWQIIAKDSYSATTSGPIWSFTTEEEPMNEPPNAPTISGPTSGKAGTAYDYIFTAIDPDGDDVKYFIDWGDNNTDWTGFSASGTPVTVSHTWAEEDTYTITAKAQDEYGLEGPEGTLEVTMPVSQQVINPLLQMILERFPNAFPILRYLLGL